MVRGGEQSPFLFYLKFAFQWLLLIGNKNKKSETFYKNYLYLNTKYDKIKSRLRNTKTKRTKRKGRMKNE